MSAITVRIRGMLNVVTIVIALVAFAGVNSVRAQADKEKELGWSFKAGLTAVWTGGNSETNAFGLTGNLRRVWEHSALGFEAGSTRLQSNLKTRTAVGTSVDSYTLMTEDHWEKTAELFYARSRYDYSVSKHFYLLAGVDWLRNEFAGIDSRTLIALGAGNTWMDEEKVRFQTSYAFTYTFQEEVVTNPLTNNKFPGARFGYNYWRKLTESTEYESVLFVDWNLDNTDDVRLDFTNSVSVAINEKMQLKPSLQLLWRNDPALTELPLISPGGTDTGLVVQEPLEQLDTYFTLALVVKI